MGILLQDIRYGLRMLAKSPGLTAIALVTLAIGIGANTALFSVVRSVLFSPLPFKDAQRLVLVQTVCRASGEGWNCSGPDYVDWVERNRVMDGLCAFAVRQFSLTEGGDPLALQGFQVSTNLFDVLQVSVALGREFRPDESQAGNDRVIILSHSLWRDRFASDPDILGKTVTVDAVPRTVIGVAGPMMGFIEEMGRIYVPLQQELLAQGNRSQHDLNVIGRVKPDVSVAQAQTQMDQIASELAREYPNSNINTGIRIKPLHKMLVDSVRTAFLVLYGAVTVLLLVACVNVSNLLIAKGLARSREIAIRQAMGAGRVRLMRQLLTESVLLAVLGGIGGLALAFWIPGMLQRIAPKIQETGGVGIPGFEEIRVNLPVLGFTIGLSLLAGLGFGIVPAWQGVRRTVANTLKETGQSVLRGRLSHRTLSTLIVVQIALAVLLLTGAGLLVRSFAKLQQSDPGFDSDRLLALHVIRPNTPENRSAEDRANYFDQVIRELTALPGVEAVGAINMHPMQAASSTSTFRIIGKEGDAPAEHRVVTSDYFKCLGIPVAQGRTFTPQDRRGSQRVVVVNRELVRRYLPDRDPIGQVIHFWGEDRTIVGVVGNVKTRSIRRDEYASFVYMPITQECTHDMTFFIRTAGEPLKWTAAARKALWNVDPSQPILYTETMTQLVRQSVSVERFCTILLTVMAGVALAMALIGLHGVMAFAVAERRNEIGIRMALGAREQDILCLVLLKGVVLTVLGLLIGQACTLALCRFLGGLLYGTSPHDPVTLVVIPLLFFAVAMLACCLPARQAVRVDPMVALRCE